MENLGLYFILQYLYMFFWMGLFLIILKFVLKNLKNKNKSQINKIDKTIYYRDIPCYGSIDIAYWLLYNFSNLKVDELNNGLIGAYLLNWHKKGYIDIKHTRKSELKNGNYNIDLKEGKWEKNYVENRIYNFLKNVAGNNNVLEKNEIRNYCNIDGHNFELKSLFNNIIKEIQEDLEKRKYITVVPSKNYILFKTKDKITLSNEIVNEYQNLNGLRNFLSDYSNIEEKMHTEVQIWEDYLIFATLLGIADNVKKQFNKIYPSFNIVNTIFDVSFDNTIEGQLNSIYKSFKLQFFVLIVCVILVGLIFWGKR